jgi:hypothetical protein
MREKRNAYRILVRTPKGRRPLGRLRSQIDLREVGWVGMDWILLAHVRDL